MAMARTPIVISRRLPEAVLRRPIGIQRRVAAMLRRWLSELVLSALAALPDHAATRDELPKEFFRFPPF